MDPVILQEKLESLRHCVTRVDAKRPAQLAELEADPDLQDIIVLNLSRAVHNYDAISWAIVYAISQRHLDDFRRFAQEIASHFPLASPH